jgi:hypothetical protein
MIEENIMENWRYTCTTPIKKNEDNIVRVMPLSEVESFTISIDGYTKLFGADRASRLERNLGCGFLWEDGDVCFVHQKLHYAPKKWWQFWKKKTIVAVTLRVG